MIILVLVLWMQYKHISFMCFLCLFCYCWNGGMFSMLSLGGYAWDSDETSCLAQLFCPHHLCTRLVLEDEWLLNILSKPQGNGWWNRRDTLIEKPFEGILISRQPVLDNWISTPDVPILTKCFSKMLNWLQSCELCVCVIKTETAELEGLSVDRNTMQWVFPHLLKLILFYHRETRLGYKNVL